MAKEYDVIVIGSGGGMKIALPAARMGLKTALIEQDAVAGTCLNRGCIPSKMLIYPSELPGHLQEATRINVKCDTRPTLDFSALITRISQTVDAMSASQRDALLSMPNLDFLPEHAEFIEDKVIQAGQHVITAPKIFIATGSRPMIPDIPGLKNTPFMTSTEALRRTSLPERLIVIGASYIAVELGAAYAGAGAQVDFIVRSRFLRQEDQEIAQVFAERFSQTHRVHQGIAPTQVSFENGLFTVMFGAQKLQGDALLVATGTVPCTDNLGLDNAGIHITKQGFIPVNDHLQTAVKGVYALGDCIGHFFFRHTVNYEGEYLVQTVLNSHSNLPLDYGPVPHAIFTNPEVAGVGLTEEQAQSQGLDYVVGRAAYSDSNSGLARGYDHGFAKLIIDRPSRRILGAHILGPEASNMIHLFIVAMKTHATLDDLLDIIFIHPALPEIARDAARDAKQRF
ncbi:MAG: dihydrolipoyl dehydrogenase [Phycisphaeraceae bacterium]|nr:dihydrolipoyl dehydrogenase [Phycisphaeraceae bacterium]